MSLLNDALRKKRAERLLPPSAAAGIASLTAGNALRLRGAKRLWVTAGCILLIALAAGIALRHKLGIPGPATLAQQNHRSDQPAPADEVTATGAENSSGAAHTAAAANPPTPAEDAPHLDSSSTTTAWSDRPATFTARTAVPESAPKRVLSAPPPSDREMQAPLTPRKPARVSLESTFPSRPVPSADVLFDKALLYHRQTRLQEAIGMYREVLNAEPGHVEAAVQLTSAYLQSQAFVQAYALTSDLLRSHPDHPRIALNQAIALIGCGRAGEAAELLIQVARHPQCDVYEVNFYSGVAYRQMGQPAEALAWYRRAELLNPTDARLLFNMGLAFDQMQDYDSAAAYYRNYLQAAGEVDAATREQVRQRVREIQSLLLTARSGVK